MKGFVYFIGANDGDTVKIGFSVHPNSRIRQIQSGNPDHLKVLHQFKATKSIERTLHMLFRPSRLKGEWFGNAVQIREFAAALETNHLARVLKLMRLPAAWPTDPVQQAAIVEKFDATSVTEHEVLRAAADLWPKEAFEGLGLRRRKRPVVAL